MLTLHASKRWIGVALGLWLSAAGACGVFGATALAAPHRAPLTKVTLATLPVADTAVAVLAEKDGFFRQQGLDVQLRIMQLGPATTSAILSGAAQFSQSNYATLFTARSRGLPVEIVAEAARGKPNFSSVVVLPNSTIKSPKDLAGKRIATSVIGGIGPLAIDAWLKADGVNYQSIKWVQMPFSAMGAALQQHQVDAAWVVEPFVTILSGTLHVRSVFPVFSGPTAGLPVSAFATSVSYAKAHPAVIAGFRRAIQEAARLAEKNPTLIRSVLPSYTAIKGALAGKIGLESYPAVTDLQQIERVATLMRSVGLLSAPLDVPAMVWGAK